MNGYRIERISRVRLKDLQPLYLDAFRKRVPIAYFEKKFSTGAFGAEYIGFLAYDKRDEPAAYYGLFPCRVKLQGQVLLSATSGDTMTHSAHRGKGLFMELAHRTYALAKDNGIRFAFGFPNQDSEKGSVKLGWQYKGERLRFFSLPVRTVPLSKMAKKLGWKGGRQEGGTVFPNSLNGNGSVIHDETFFLYKKYSPKKVIRINGTRAWVKMDGAMKVGDVERSAAADMLQFLNGIRNYAFWRGISEVQFLVSTGTWLEESLSSCMKGMDAFPVGHFHFDTEGLDLSQMRYGMADLDTF